MPLLKTPWLVDRSRTGPQTAGHGETTLDSCHTRDVETTGHLADRHAVVTRPAAAWGVHDELDLSVCEPLSDVAWAFSDLVDYLGIDGVVPQVAGRSAGGDKLESEHCERLRDRQTDLFVPVGEGEEDPSPVGQDVARCEEGLAIGDTDIRADAHDFTGCFHLWPQDRVFLGESIPRQHRVLDRNESVRRLVGDHSLLT